MRILPFVFSLLAFTTLSQIQQTTNPFSKTEIKIDTTSYDSPADSLEATADIENARIQQLISQRKRLNDVNIYGIQINTNMTCNMELEVSDNGNVVNVEWLSGTNDEYLKNKIIENVLRQVKYTKLDLGFNTLHKYTIHLMAR
ncbi:MAG: hypothetical protein ACFHU9_12195 [Fluviicola sp.]